MPIYRKMKLNCQNEQLLHQHVSIQRLKKLSNALNKIITMHMRFADA
jgi:hypothetical protein